MTLQECHLREVAASTRAHTQTLRMQSRAVWVEARTTDALQLVEGASAVALMRHRRT